MEHTSLSFAPIRRQALLLLLFLFTSPPIVLAEQEMPVYSTWNERVLDDPEEALRLANEQFKTLDPVQQPEIFAQIALFLLRNDWSAGWAGHDLEGTRERARAIAEKAGWADAAMIFAFDKIEREVRRQKDYALVKAAYLDAMEQAKKQSLHLAYAWLASAMAYSEYEQGDYAEALEIGRDALDQILKVRDLDDADTLSLKNTLAVILEALGNKTQTIEVYEDLEKYLRQRKLRYSLAIVLCNHGLLLVHANMDVKKAEELYKEALGIAKDLRNDYLLTLANKGIADTLINQGKMEQALEYLNQGLVSSKTFSEYDLLRASTFLAKGKVLVEMKRWQEALDAIARTENPANTQDKNTLRTIRFVQARALAGLGDYKRAFEAQKEAFDLLETLSNESREKETNRLHVQLGLELQELKSKALKSENELQRQAALVILGLAFFIIGLLGYALRKSGEVKRSRERMQRILDNIEEGIVTIGQGMKVESSLSPYIYKLLDLDDEKNGEQTVFQQLLAAVDSSEDEKATLRAILETSLGEDRATWDFNVGQLPQQLSLHQGRQWIGLHWQALTNEAGQVQSILIAVRDVTETLRLAKERDSAEQHRIDSERHLQELLLIDPREARSFVREFTSTLRFLDETLVAGEHMVECRRALHTCKGLARTLGFKELSQLVHEMEDALDGPYIGGLLSRLKAIFQEYEVWVQRLYPEGGSSRQPEARTLHEQVGRLIPNVRTLLQKAELDLAGFLIDDQVMNWEPATLDLLANILIHGLNNSVDHGFILPLKRGQIQTAKPCFELHARLDGSRYLFRLRDNGVGLDQKQLQRLAHSRGFQPRKGQDYSDVLFLDGVSTADSVSSTSGRGVGLAAIRQICSEHAGTVRLHTIEGSEGTCLEWSLPISRHDPIMSSPIKVSNH